MPVLEVNRRPMVLADQRRAASRGRRAASPRPAVPPSRPERDPDRLAPTRTDALRRIAAEVSGQHDLVRPFDEVIDEAFGLFGVDRAGLWLYDPNGTTPLRLGAQRGLSSEIIDAIASIPHDATTMGMGVLHRAMRRTSAGLRQIYRSIGVRSVCYVPLVFGQEILGLLVLYHREAYDWTSEERDLARAFGDQMATSIGSARLAATSRTLAERLASIADLASRLGRF